MPTIPEQLSDKSAANASALATVGLLPPPAENASPEGDTVPGTPDVLTKEDLKTMDEGALLF